VFDGTEIQEAVFTLLEITRRGGRPLCLAPNVQQMHVIDHRTGEEMSQIRNVLVESARIARGDIHDVRTVTPEQLDALVIPGGFGTAKNHTRWAVSGPDGEIRDDVRELIRGMVHAHRPVVGLCMAPTTIAKALDGTNVHAALTVGSTAEPSPYDIDAISAGMERIGAHATESTVREITVDVSNAIITAPCYLMEASIVEVHANVVQAMDALFTMLDA
jgi:enhancing lycopene biosynthesis protein 2